MDFYSIRRDADYTLSEISLKKDEIDNALYVLQDAKDSLENYEDTLQNFLDAIATLEDEGLSIDVSVEVNFDL